MFMVQTACLHLHTLVWIDCMTALLTQFLLDHIDGLVEVVLLALA